MDLFIELVNYSINEKKSINKLSKYFLFLVIILIGCIIISGAVTAKTITVTPHKNAIKHAITHAHSGDTLKLKKGTYKEHNLNIKKNLIITGPSFTGTKPKAKIDAQKKGRIFIINHGVKLTIKNLKLTNAKYGGNGGAIYNKGTCTIKRSTFTKNNAWNYGGAIYNKLGSSMTITSSIFTSNDADSESFFWGDGGGAICNYGNKLTITSCTFTGNTAWNSAAIFNSGSYLTITKCKFNNNFAEVNGGAILNVGGLTVKDSVFINNSAVGEYGEGGMGYGGAIYSINGPLNVTGTTFTNNFAEQGSAISGRNSIMTIMGNVFTTNYAGYGTIYNDGCTSNIHSNWFIGNNAYYRGNVIDNEAGTVDASLNWWGSNTGPSTKDIYGTVTVIPWLVL